MIQMVESHLLDSMNLYQGLGPRYEKLKHCYCGTTFASNLVGPSSRRYSTHLKYHNSNLGPILSPKVQYMKGCFGPPSFFMVQFQYDKGTTSLSILMASVIYLHLSVQEEDIMGHTNGKRHVFKLEFVRGRYSQA